MGLTEAIVRRGGGERWYYVFFPSKLAGGASSPLIPLFVLLVLHLGVASVTVAVVSVSVATVPGYILWGDYTDKERKRKQPIVLGMAVTTLALGIMALSPDLLTFVLGNVIYGFFLAATVPSSTMLIMEKTPKDRWGAAIGLFTKVSGVGWMLGMALGTVYFLVAPAFISIELAMRLFFGICTVMSAVSWALAQAWIEEPEVRLERRWFFKDATMLRGWVFEKARHIPSVMLYVFSPRIIRKARRFFPGWGRDLDMYLLASFILFFGIQVFYVPFPVMLASELQLDSSRIFVVYLVGSLTAAAMYAWAGREVDKLGNRESQLIAWGARAAIFPSFAVCLVLMSWGHPTLAFAAVLGLSASMGTFYSIVSVAGTTTATELVPEYIMGEAVGAYNAIIGVGMIFGGLAGGAIAAGAGYYAVAFTAGVLTVVAVAILLRLRFK